MAEAATLDAPTVAERVAAGVAWLDQRQPDWWELINLPRLDMWHSCKCVLGQLYGDYYAVPIELDRSVAMGFDAQDRRPDGDFEALQEEWTRVIEERREAARVAASCCPCLGLTCEPGCKCADCPKTETELTDDAD